MEINRLTEDEGSIWWDLRRAASLAICQCARNSELSFTTDLHTEDAFVPAFDNFSPSDAEGELK